MTTATRPSPDAATPRRPAGSRAAGLVVSGVVLLALCVCSLAFGVRSVSIEDVLAASGGRVDTVSQAAVSARIPRTVLAVLIGAALALSGAAMQAITRNPLADPGILGVSGGAALAVVVGLAFFGLAAPYALITVAIVGAAVAAVFVYAVGSLGRGGATPLKLALAGAAISAAFASVTSAVLLPRADVMEAFRFWQIGGVGGATWDRVGIVAPVLAVGALIVFLTARGMDSLALGDDMAAGLGEDVARTRLVASTGAVVLCGAATAVAGPIAFVGLVIPHLCRLLVGPDQRWVLPFTAVLGAALLVAADVVGRLIARPEEIEVGIVTALIGAPVFIWIVRKQRVREL
ncbi:iron ABC transporter permease [Microbacterium aquimaris]|uniref:FecCD family ABC transporter permease n=1 Tax=Microbacterium aquimaris TaxID=459816 RepID=UPI002AD21E88|nr:iron ABC transporter permease [Microbacterium aquimaris]MDZ8276132.1 iron ABC transporter permease [Microbacterium aquimaris]